MYFAALIPDEPELSEIQKIKEEFAEKYGAIRALRSPAHITIIPPFRHPEFPVQLIKELKENLQAVERFSVVTDRYDAFPPRVIFLKIPESVPLNSVYEDSRKAFIDFGQSWTWNRPFHPHLTIAFRDLRPDVFLRAMKENSKLDNPMNLRFSGLSLLKLSADGWKPDQEGFVTFK